METVQKDEERNTLKHTCTATVILNTPQRLYIEHLGKLEPRLKTVIVCSRLPAGPR